MTLCNGQASVMEDVLQQASHMENVLQQASDMEDVLQQASGVAVNALNVAVLITGSEDLCGIYRRTKYRDRSAFLTAAVFAGETGSLAVSLPITELGTSLRGKMNR
ncbi:hypothetical protein KM043_005671 [Ampulex compressa]|nr:hypothetical protein KM043_005671 [Ampulex compressa]